MHVFWVLAALLGCVGPVMAQARLEQFYGTWGDRDGCSAYRAGVEGLYYTIAPNRFEGGSSCRKVRMSVSRDTLTIRARCPSGEGAFEPVTEQFRLSGRFLIFREVRLGRCGR